MVGSLLAEETAQPNIIVFLVDDMGLMDSSVPFLADASGKPKKHPLNQFYRTPSMERLADMGTRFTNFYAHTVCSPTRISIMTGQNSARHTTTQWINPWSKNGGNFAPPGWNWEGLKSSDATLPALLERIGYETIFIGKAHFAPLNHEGANPRNLGFMVNIGGAAWGHPRSYYGRDHYGNHPKYMEGKRGMTHNVPHLEAYYADDVFLSEALTLEAKAAMDDAIKAQKPFYLHMAHYAVHTPFQSDDRFADNYRNSGKSPPAQAFATLIEGMDKSLGDLIDHLKERGIADNTLIFFLGDNGSDAPLGNPDAIASSSPLRGKKGSKWEGGIRVPFMAAWAAKARANAWQKKLPIAAGAMRFETGACFDIFPTILSLLDQSVPAGHAIDGQDLSPLLSGVGNSNHRNVFLSHFPHPRHHKHFTSYRSEDWKIIYSYNPEQQTKPSYELYNLREDLSESNNLAESHPEQLKSLALAMSRELEAMQALYPTQDGKSIKPIIPE